VRKAWVRAERDSEVRQAARAWRKAGAIDDRALAAVEELFPAPWPNPTPVWSVLAFFFVSFAVVGLLAAIASANAGHAIATVAFLQAVLLAVAAESLRPSVSGAASASGTAAAFWSVTCLMIASADATHWGKRSVTLLLIVGAVAWAAAAWRWGYPVFAVFSSAFFFLFLARFAPGRALWFVLGSALAAACVPLLDRPSLPPSHRRSAAGTLAVCLIAVYVAVNPYSVDRDIVESIAFSHVPAAGPASFLRVPAALAIVVLPLFLLAWGIRSRRVLLLDLAIVFTALSLATLRYYVHIAPLWAVLAVSGAGLIGLALSVHRWLDRAPGRQRRGFTGDALFENEDRQQALGAVGAALTLAPGARSAPKPEPGAFQGGGGVSGGGGSSESF
jgi:hypothetical protein